MLHKIPLLSLLSSFYFHFFQFTLFSHCNVVLCIRPICLFWGSSIRITMPTGSMSAWYSWLGHTNATLSKHVYYKTQGVFNQSSTVKARSWGSNPEPWRVSSLSIKRCGKNRNPLIAQLLPISHTFCPIPIHYLFRFLRTQSLNSCEIKLMFSTIYPKSFYYLSHI